MSRDLRFLVAALFIWGFGEGMFFYFQPLYLQQWGADPLQIGAILGGMGIAMTLSMAPAGYLADRFGTRPIMWASWFIGLITAWMMALANSLPVFIAGLILYWATGFGLIPINSYVTATRGKWSIGRALTICSGGYQLGAVIGPLVAGQIAEIYGLRSIYVVGSCFLIVSTVLILFLRPQAVVAHDHSTSQGRVWQNKRFLTFLGVSFLVMLATVLPQPLAANFLQNERGLSLVEIGWLGSLGSLGNAVMTLALGHLNAPFAFLVGQMSAGLFALMLWRGSGFPWFGIGYFFYGGSKLARSMASALTRPMIRDSEVGLAYGLLETVNASTAILAPPIAGALYTYQVTLIYPISLALLAISLTASGLFFYARRNAREEIEHAA